MMTTNADVNVFVEQNKSEQNLRFENLIQYSS